jgi:hypothetical protein
MTATISSVFGSTIRISSRTRIYYPATSAARNGRELSGPGIAAP